MLFHLTLYEANFYFETGVVAFGPSSELPQLSDVEAIYAGNAFIKPAVGRAHPVPWAGHGKYKVGEVLCEMHWSDGSYQEACPRTVARRQLKKLHDHGFALKSAFEMEFMLEHSKTSKSDQSG